MPCDHVHFHVAFLCKPFVTNVTYELWYFIALISYVTRQIVSVFVDFSTLLALVESGRNLYKTKRIRNVQTIVQKTVLLKSLRTFFTFIYTIAITRKNIIYSNHINSLPERLEAVCFLCKWTNRSCRVSRTSPHRWQFVEISRNSFKCRFRFLLFL